MTEETMRDKTKAKNHLSNDYTEYDGFNEVYLKAATWTKVKNRF